MTKSDVAVKENNRPQEILLSITMSSSSQPIPSHRFAAAIKELPLANLHSKAAEIRNSISHLEASNQQLKSYADDGDRDCAEAIQENVLVIHRMEERIRLLKSEVEGRGFRWGEDEDKVEDGATITNGTGHNERSETSPQVADGSQQNAGGGGRLGDEELARRLREQMGGYDDEEETEEGVHL